MINVGLILLGFSHALRYENVRGDIDIDGDLGRGWQPSGTVMASEDNQSFVQVQSGLLICTTSGQFPPQQLQDWVDADGNSHGGRTGLLQHEQDRVFLIPANEAEFWAYHDTIGRYFTQANYYGSIEQAERMGETKPSGAPHCVPVPFGDADSLPSLICDTCLSVSFNEAYLSTCSRAQTLTQFRELDQAAREQSSTCKVGSMMSMKERVDACLRARESVPEFDVSDARQHCTYDGDFRSVEDKDAECLFDIFDQDCAVGRAVLLSDGHCYAKDSVKKYRGSTSPITKEAWSGSTLSFWTSDHTKCEFGSDAKILRQVQELDEKVRILLEQKRAIEAQRDALREIVTRAAASDMEVD
jgi:hypothetical protein